MRNLEERWSKDRLLEFSERIRGKEQVGVEGGEVGNGPVLEVELGEPVQKNPIQEVKA